MAAESRPAPPKKYPKWRILSMCRKSILTGMLLAWEESIQSTLNQMVNATNPVEERRMKDIGAILV
jgi:hypothetical protein